MTHRMESLYIITQMISAAVPVRPADLFKQTASGTSNRITTLMALVGSGGGGAGFGSGARREVFPLVEGLSFPAFAL